MRQADLLGLAFSALGRQKVRTALTLLGVTIGTFTLVVSLSVGRGVDQAIVGLFRETQALRTVSVSQRYETVPEDVPESERHVEGPMSDSRRARLSAALVKRWGQRHVSRPRAKLTPARLKALGRIPHVERVTPQIHLSGTAELSDAAEPQDVQIASVDPNDDYRDRIVTGRPFSPGDDRAVIVHELLLYRWGLTREVEVRGLLGRSIRLEYRNPSSGRLSLFRLLRFGDDPFSNEQAQALRRAFQRIGPFLRLLPIPREERQAFAKLLEQARDETEAEADGGPPVADTFTIIGIIRDPSEEEDAALAPLNNWWSRQADVLLPTSAMAAFYLRSPKHAEAGFDQVRLTIDRDANVRQVADRVETLGFSQYSLTQFIDTVRLNVLLITFATAFIAVVALAVAAIGITNTMIMSVLERTHEIGVMKALGARDGQVRALFLVEGSFLGLLGGGLGLLFGWLASFPGDTIARSIMESQTPRPISGSLFVFPPWLTIGVPALAALITTLAAVYPAQRAARVDPITSLRHD